MTVVNVPVCSCGCGCEPDGDWHWSQQPWCPCVANGCPCASTTSIGSVERAPYVGDSDIIRVACAHGDYSNIFKGATERHGEKALAAHYSARHQ